MKPKTRKPGARLRGKMTAALTQLQRAELVRQSGAPDADYSFKHSLVQEMAYASLLKQDRRELHRRVAHALEHSLALAPDDLAAQLAWHYDEAGDEVKALEYRTRAGDAAFRVHALAEAIAQYNRALQLAKQLQAQQQPLAPGTCEKLCLQRGRALELAGRYQDALDSYLEMENYARTRGDAALELTALLARTPLYATFTPLYNPAMARRLAEQALDLARRENNRPAEAKILWLLIMTATFGESNPLVAVEYGVQSLAIARELGLKEQIAFTLHDLFYPCLFTRPMPEVLQSVQEAQELWRALGNEPMLIDSLVHGNVVYHLMGEYDANLAQSAMALELAQRIGNVWGQSYINMHSSYVHWERGEPARAFAAMQASIELGGQVGFKAPRVFSGADWGWMLVQLGAAEEGLELIRQALDCAARELPLFGAWANAAYVRALTRLGELEQAQTAMTSGPFRLDRPQRTFEHPGIIVSLAIARAEIALAFDDASSAAQFLASAEEYLENRAVRAHLPEVLTLQARIQMRQQQWNQAAALLQQALSVAQALDARWQLWQIYAALAELETRRGAMDAAQTYRNCAREFVEHLAAHTPDEYRAAFLNLPRVRELRTENFHAYAK